MEPANILFVDDETAFLRSARRLFTPRHRVVTADRPDQALALIRGESFDVVVSDYRMPGMNGVDFLERVRGLRPATVRLLVTGAHDFDAVVAAVNRGSIFRFVAKPFDLDDLLNAVESGVDIARLGAERDRLAAELARRNDELARLNAGLADGIRARTREVVDALRAALDARDGAPPGPSSSDPGGDPARRHATRVAATARRVAEAMGLADRDQDEAELGALLHDLGTLAVPDRVRCKPGPLTLDEWDSIRRHPEVGWQILSSVETLAGAARVVREHRERWDGKGYPRGLAGEAIAVGARILAVAEAYDASTAGRPAGALPSEVARGEIRRGAGQKFDPRVVEAFLGLPGPEFTAIPAAIDADADGGAVATRRLASASVEGGAPAPFFTPNRPSTTAEAKSGMSVVHGP